MTISNGYTTLATLKAWLDTDQAIADHDVDLERFVNAASRLIDTYCGRRFYADDAVAAKTFRPEDAYELDLPDVYTTSGLIVKSDDNGDGTYEITWAADDYQLEPLNPQPGWPWWRLVAIDEYTFPGSSRRPTVQVTAKWGWAAVPAEVEQVCLHIAGEMWKRKDAPFGVVGFDQIGAGLRIASTYAPILEQLAMFRRMSVIGV